MLIVAWADNVRRIFAQYENFSLERLTYYLVYSFILSARILLTPTGYSFWDIELQICRHIALGRNSYFKKILGIGPPRGQFFPKFFFEISIWKCEGVMPLTQETICKKNFHDRIHRASATTADVRCSACSSGYAARRRLCRRAIGHVTVTSK